MSTNSLSPWTRATSVAAIAALAACALGTLEGCRQRGADDIQTNRGEYALSASRETHAAAHGTSEFDLDTPMIIGSPAGLEVVVLMVRQPPEIVDAVLNAYRGSGSTLGDDQDIVWNAHALQAVRVPVQNLAALIAGFESNTDATNADTAASPSVNTSAMAGGGGGARQWVGQTPTWQEIARGITFPRGVTLALERERVELPAGRLRLLARSWIVPTPPSSPASAAEVDTREGGADAALRIELAVQHELTRDARRATGQGMDDLALPSDPTAMNEGILLPSLSASLTLRAGEAVVIVPREPMSTTEAMTNTASAGVPANETSATSEPAPAPIGIGQVSRDGAGSGARESNTLSYGPKPAGESGSAVGPAGPPSPRLPTVGQALLGEGARAGARVSRRQVIVLIPRLPEKFELLERE